MGKCVHGGFMKAQPITPKDLVELLTALVSLLAVLLPLLLHSRP